MKELVINGELRHVPNDATISDVVAGVVSEPRGVAVAVDGSVVPRASWPIAIAAGARVEIVTAVQGG